MVELSSIYESYFNPNVIGTGLKTLKNKFNAILNTVTNNKNTEQYGAIDTKSLLKRTKKSLDLIEKMLAKSGFRQEAVTEDVVPDNNNIYNNTFAVLNRLRELKRHMIAAQRVKPKPVNKIGDLKITRGTILDIENLQTQWNYILQDLADEAPTSIKGKLLQKIRRGL